MRKYLKTLRNFISEFNKRQGFYIFLSRILTRVARFISVTVVVRLLTPETYGQIAYAFSIIAVITPFAGLGASHSLLRFGSIQKGSLNKYKLFLYSIKYSILFSSVLIIIIWLLSATLTKKLPGSDFYLNILSFQLLGVAVLETLLNYMRILKKNKLYSYIGVTKSFFSVIIVILLTYLYSGTGYSLGIILSSFLVFIYFLYKYKVNLNFGLSKKISISTKEFWRYGLYVGVGSIASQLLFSVDIFFIGNMIAEPEQLAIYKIATIIPYQLMFIPSTFLVADFVMIAEKHQDGAFLLNYYKKYLLLFSLIVIGMITFSFLLNEEIIGLVFGKKYLDSAELFLIIMVGIAGSFLVRAPLGNILAAIGKANWNVINAFIILAIDVILNYFFIPEFGLKGAAYATVLSIWIGAFIAIIMFIYYLVKLKK